MLNQPELRPSPGFKPPEEDRPSQYKIDAHADGHANDAPPHPQAKEGGKEQARGNRQEDGDQHGKLHVARCP